MLYLGEEEFVFCHQALSSYYSLSTSEQWHKGPWQASFKSRPKGENSGKCLEVWSSWSITHKSFAVYEHAIMNGTVPKQSEHLF